MEESHADRSLLDLARARALEWTTAGQSPEEIAARLARLHWKHPATGSPYTADDVRGLLEPRARP